ncbi:MAG: hypothetical protein ACYDCK_15170, partial [Thermoplasmatota archaeon]
YDLGKEIHAEWAGSSHHALNLFGADGSYDGSLVLLSSNGPALDGQSLSWDGSASVSASMNPGDQMVFEAKPVYVDDGAFNAAATGALIDGLLADTIVTEYSGSTESKSQVDYFSGFSAETSTLSDGSISTDVQSQTQHAAMISYDLAYESLPAQTAGDVALYADGALAARASTPGEVQQNAAAGVPSYFALAANGRMQILASTPDFRANAEHVLTLVANTAGSVEQARAESQSSSESNVAGEWQYHENGKLTGTFATSVLDAQNNTAHDYTDLPAKADIFESIHLEGTAAGNLQASGPHAFTLATPNADLTMLDNLFATILVTPHADTSAEFVTAENVKATLINDHVVSLAGPNGFAGYLVIVGHAEANAQTSAQPTVPAAPAAPAAPDAPSAPSAPAAPAAPGAPAAPNAHAQFVMQSEHDIHANLKPDTPAVFFAEPQAPSPKVQADDSVIANAIAEGRIGSEALTGWDGRAVSVAATDFHPTVHTEFVGQARGHYQVNYQPTLPAMDVMLFEARGSSLLAKTSSDIQVTVDGRAAIAVDSASAALAPRSYPAYYVDTSSLGEVRTLVNTAAAPRSTAHVDIQSRLDSAARLAVNKDAFGTFQLFDGGRAVGSFVSLVTSEQAGVITDYSLAANGETIFSSIEPGHSAFVSPGTPGLPTLALSNQETHVDIADTTNAYMRVVADVPTNVRFDLAPGMNAVASATNIVTMNAADGQLAGSMIITSLSGTPATASYFGMSADHSVNAHLESGAEVIFKADTGIERELSDAQRSMINTAIAEGRLGGHVLVETSPSLSAANAAEASARARLEANAQVDGSADARGVTESAQEAAGQVTSAITTAFYNDVQMVTAATQDRIDVTLSSTSAVGKTVIISLDQATLPSLSAGEADILIDGHLAQQASSYADVLNPSDDNGVAEYFVLTGEAGSQVLVSIPHFSTHTVTLVAHEASAPPVFMYATIFLGVVVAAETVLLVRRKVF